MHNYILLDVIEEYELEDNLNKKFVGHKYLIGCYTCEQTRIIRQDTFNKLYSHGLIEDRN